jgi:predicted amidophosphoribosyltransferase
MHMKIYCPRCEYRPRASDRWQCRPGCYTIWNTFDTHAVCPGCSKQWRETWCPACAERSPHDDWYHDERTDQAVEEHEEELVGVA